MASPLLVALALAASEAPALPVAPNDPATPTIPATPPPAIPAAGAPQLAPDATEGAKAREGARASEPDEDRPLGVPPSLTRKAFEDEVRRAARIRQNQRKQAEEERARLEKLASDIAAARAALKDETARLEELAKRPAASPGGAPESSRKTPDVDKASIEALARTLKGMRPEHGAAVLAHLDKKLAVGLLRRLRPADAAAIAEKLKPETAAELFSLVAHAGAEESR